MLKIQKITQRYRVKPLLLSLLLAGVFSMSAVPKAAAWPPSAPTQVRVTATTTNSISISWNAVSGASWYVIYRNGQSQYVGYVDAYIRNFTDTGLASGTQYYYQVTAVNSWFEASAMSARAYGTTQTSSSSPSVSLTAPANNATVSGTVTATATAGAGTVGVQFRVNGNNYGSPDYSAPYSRSIDTTAFSNGSYTITAVSWNSANQTAESSVAVTFNNTAPQGPEKRCGVFLHGATGTGQATMHGDPTYIFPTGNAYMSPGRMWLYTTETTYQQALTSIKNSIPSDCTKIILHGFSNGAAMAAKVYCKGETFNNRLIGVIIDDPVMDHGTDNCARPAGVQVAAYYTDAILYGPNYNCVANGYTNCEGGELIGKAAFQSNVGVTLQRSPHNTHTLWQYPPPYSQWW